MAKLWGLKHWTERAAGRKWCRELQGCHVKCVTGSAGGG